MAIHVQEFTLGSVIIVINRS